MTTGLLTDQAGAESTRLRPLRLVAREAPIGRAGEAPHVSTCCRWVQKGVRLRSGERLRLRAVRTPSGWLSCQRWMDEFLAALTRDRIGVEADGSGDDDDHGHGHGDATPCLTSPPRPGPRSPGQRREAARRAAERSAALGC